jgi:hypothetical protein
MASPADRRIKLEHKKRRGEYFWKLIMAEKREKRKDLAEKVGRRLVNGRATR